MDLFSLYVSFFHFRPRYVTLGNCFFIFLSNIILCTCLCMHNLWNFLGNITWSEMGKPNVQAKEVHSFFLISFYVYLSSFCIDAQLTKQCPTIHPLIHNLSVGAQKPFSLSTDPPLLSSFTARLKCVTQRIQPRDVLKAARPAENVGKWNHFPKPPMTCILWPKARSHYTERRESLRIYLSSRIWACAWKGEVSTLWSHIYLKTLFTIMQHICMLWEKTYWNRFRDNTVDSFKARMILH